MNNLKKILIIKSEEKAATQFIQRIRILDQFRAVIKQERKKYREENV